MTVLLSLRPPSVEVVEPPTFIPPQSLLLKSSSGGEVPPSRLLLHAPLPCRPQPIKGSPVSLSWSCPPLRSLMMSPPPKANLLPFPSLALAQNLRPGPAWLKQGAPKLSPAEQTVLFRLRSLSEHTEAPRRSQEKKEQQACWTEQAGSGGTRETLEGPLDLSERGKSSSRSPSEPQHSPELHLKTEPSPQGDTCPLSSPESPEEEPAAGSKTQVRSRSSSSSVVEKEGGKEQEQKKEVNGMKEQSSDKKVPVLTISLRPGEEGRPSVLAVLPPVC